MTRQVAAGEVAECASTEPQACCHQNKQAGTHTTKHQLPPLWVQTPVAPVGRMLGKACQLYEARAYVHQYERYGLSCADFQEAFEVVEGMLERYRAL